MKKIKRFLKPFKILLMNWLWKRVILLRYRKKEFLIQKKIKSGSPVKVVFLVREVAKWNASTVYKEMHESELFDPVVALSIIKDQFEETNERRTEIAKNKAFFDSLGIKAKVLYNPNEDSEGCLSELNPDLIFYDQPWSLKNRYNLKLTSQFALSVYIPYSLEIANTAEATFNTEFQNLLWLYCAPNEYVQKTFTQGRLSKPLNSFVSGYPKLDAYLVPLKKSEDRKIIYAPHHSLEKKSGLQYATFEWSGRLMLELVKKNPEIDWVFKPHPRLKSALVTNGFMTSEEVVDYYKTWVELPNSSLCDDGDYFEVFKSSDAMITDCVSFLAEYLPTEKPILHMINPQSIGYNALGSLIIKDYYKSVSQQEFLVQFDRVVVNRDDFLKGKRLQALEYVYIAKEGAGKTITEYLSSKLRSLT